VEMGFEALSASFLDLDITIQRLSCCIAIS
jgi:hypothetical protein